MDQQSQRSAPSEGSHFNAVRISLASPKQILDWSYGEVTKPETINYRTLKPEKDGLFDERIFGPTRDWECACGKYKKQRYRGVKCERCGVEVTRARVRRERMGHISLAAPVAHIWFAKGTPSRIGLLLDLTPRNLDRVLYFSHYIITSVDETARQARKEELERAMEERVRQVREGAEERLRQAEAQAQARLQDLEARYQQERSARLAEFQERVAQGQAREEDLEAFLRGVEERYRSARAEVEASLQKARLEVEELEDQAREPFEEEINELESLRVGQLLNEVQYRDLQERFPGVFTAGMGAEAILELLSRLDLNALRDQLVREMHEATGQRRKKAIRRLRVVEAFRKSGNRPEWMILTVLPVLPPELRPMVQLDGGRFATSDLNDLYRRVINRNNRLKRLLELQAPDIIVRNEKRMLQEAVDALIDNGRRGRPLAGSRNHKLKSLSDLLQGKQGRFRQNLLGKRVDYSGRSVIVVGPQLKLHQCGLPKRMALELFKPFVMHKLELKGYAANVKAAKRMVERGDPVVWDVLEEVVRDRPVLLNRAPTLHRLGIQAFMPVLIEGSAIQIHPLVCTAFNADFDGDQMAVHVPLSRMAVLEAKRLMLSTYNLLSPASGEPIAAPTLDIVLGWFYATTPHPYVKGAGRLFRDYDEVLLAHQLGEVHTQAPIRVLDAQAGQEVDLGQGVRARAVDTVVGRVLFRDLLPPNLQQEVSLWNRVQDKGTLKELVDRAYSLLGEEETARMLDRIKELGYRLATQSGTTIAIGDLHVPATKAEILQRAEEEVQDLYNHYEMGLIDEEEFYRRRVEVWDRASQEMERVVQAHLPEYGGIYLMAQSGAKGNIAQIKQMVGMRGLMTDPKGKLIPVPVRSSFREGLSVLEYFISTHGARKGLTDTALRTADSGYLTRRMVDVAQDVIVREHDCGTDQGIWILHEPEKEEQNFVDRFPRRIVGRVAAQPIVHPETGEVLVDRNQEIREEDAQRIWEAGVRSVYVRSPLTCQTPRGVCSLCYGRLQAKRRLALVGEAVGVIAAQSIGEPGTQLTMRTFHTGGIKGVDITSGIPRVQELFEARVPKYPAILSEIDGTAFVERLPGGVRIRVVSEEEYPQEHPLPPGYIPVVEEGQEVEPGTVLAVPPPEAEETALAQPVAAQVHGTVHLEDGRIVVYWKEKEERIYPSDGSLLPPVYTVPRDLETSPGGKPVKAGDVLAYGPGGPDVKNPHDILRIQGKEAVQKYILEEVQKVYRRQGVNINDKHIEVIIRQMLRKVKVEQVGDTDFLPGDLVDRFVFAEKNQRVLAEGGEPARAVDVLLGITRAALATESFLAAASFQETTRVLADAAVRGAVDHLYGLKENVIIGRLIPARFDATPEGRRILGLPPEPEPTPFTPPPREAFPSLDFPWGNGHPTEEGPGREGHPGEAP